MANVAGEDVAPADTDMVARAVGFLLAVVSLAVLW